MSKFKLGDRVWSTYHNQADTGSKEAATVVRVTEHSRYVIRFDRNGLGWSERALGPGNRFWNVRDVNLSKLADMKYSVFHKILKAV